MLLTEAKAILTLPELIIGTKEVLPDAIRNPFKGKIEYKVSTAKLMKTIMFSGNVDGYKSVIQFHDYVEKEVLKPTSALAALAFNTAGMEDSIDSAELPARVSCNCNEYLAYFAQANDMSDAHYGISPKEVDARDLGYKKPQYNLAHIPGMCRHIYGFYLYLKEIHKVK